MDKRRKKSDGRGDDGEERDGGEETTGFGCDEVRRGVSKDILPSMFYESDHISSERGRQPQKHIADQDLCVCERKRSVCV